MNKDNAVLAEYEIERAGSEFRQLEATLARLRAHLDGLARENERLQRERDSFCYYTEAEAAEIFKLRNAASLADLRTQHRLPHCKIGHKVRYTPLHIAEITKFFEIRREQTGRLKQK